MGETKGPPVLIQKKIYIHILLHLAALIFCYSAVVYAETTIDNDLSTLSIEELMSIQVTSVSKKPQNLADSAAAIFVITNKDLLHSGVTCIPEALRMVPGLHVARIDSNKWAVSSRGFNNRFTKKLLVIIDGRTVYTPGFSGVYWEIQDLLLEDVERIEVIRGPGASLWGANAVNGVINIITKNAADTQGGLISAGGGTAEKSFGSVRYGTALGPGTYGRIYAKYFNRDEFQYHDGGNAGDNWDSFRTGFRIDSKMTGPVNLTIQGDVYTDGINQRALNTPSSLPPYTQVVEDDVSTSGGNLLARWQRIVSSSSDITMQAYYDRTERDDVYCYEKRNSFDLDFQHRFAPTDGHDMLWGARYHFTRDDIVSRYILEFDPASSSDQLFSAFIQDEITIVDERLWLILGSKFEHNDYSGYEVQPSGRLLWAPHPEHRLWGAISRAVRTPSRVEHDGHLNVIMIPPLLPVRPFPIKITIDGDSSFDSEELMAYELGYRFIPACDFSLDLTVFFNDYDNLQEYVVSEPVLNNGVIEQSLVSENGGSGDIYGMEASAVWQPVKWLETALTYSFLHSDATERGVPNHQVSLRIGITPVDKIDVDAWLRYVDDVKASYNTAKEGLGMYEIDAYLTLDLRIAWHLTKNLELIVVGQNLLDEGHMEFVQEILIAPTEISRSFYGQVKYSF